jgi:hypothetical protein
MVSTNKSLAQMNKSGDLGQATKTMMAHMGTPSIEAGAIARTQQAS